MPARLDRERKRDVRISNKMCWTYRMKKSTLSALDQTERDEGRHQEKQIYWIAMLQKQAAIE